MSTRKFSIKLIPRFIDAHAFHNLVLYPNHLNVELVLARRRWDKQMARGQLSPHVWGDLNPSYTGPIYQGIQRRAHLLKPRILEIAEAIKIHNREYLRSLPKAEAAAALLARESTALKWAECLPRGIDQQEASDISGLVGVYNGWVGLEQICRITNPRK